MKGRIDMEDSYNFDALLGQVGEKLLQADVKAKKAYELAAEHSINLVDLIPAMGTAIEAYISTIRMVEHKYSDADMKRAVQLSFAGMLIGVKVHEIFGLKMNDMYGVVDAMYKYALFKIKYQYGNPEGEK